MLSMNGNMGNNESVSQLREMGVNEGISSYERKNEKVVEEYGPCTKDHLSLPQLEQHVCPPSADAPGF